jgi:hypothetical protein
VRSGIPVGLAAMIQEVEDGKRLLPDAKLEELLQS